MVGTVEFHVVLQLGTDGFQSCGPGLGEGPRRRGSGSRSEGSGAAMLKPGLGLMNFKWSCGLGLVDFKWS